MTKKNQNIEHWQGDTHVIRIKVDDGAETPGPIDLAGASARWWMGKTEKATGADIYVKKSTALDDGIVLDGPDGDGFWTVVIGLDPADTVDTPVGKFYHECVVVDAGGDVSHVTIGKFTCNQSLIPEDE